MVRFAARWERSQISTIKRPRIPTSERYQGLPEPSTICAPAIMMSKGSDWAKPNGAISRNKTRVKQIRCRIGWAPLRDFWCDAIRERIDDREKQAGTIKANDRSRLLGFSG